MKPYYSDDLVTLSHGDCIEVMRGMPDESVHAVVTDPPYNLSDSGKRDSKCFREVVANVLLPDDNERNAEGFERCNFPSPAFRRSPLSGESRAARVDASVRVPERSIDLKNAPVMELEVGARNESTALAPDGNLAQIADFQPIEFGGDFILKLADGGDATFCNGTCSCFTEPSAGCISVAVVVPEFARGDGARDCVHVDGSNPDVGSSDNTLRKAEGATGIHTGGRAEHRAVLRLDLHRGTGELDLAHSAAEHLPTFEIVRAETVGADAGAGRLSPMAQAHRVGLVGDPAGRTFTLYQIAHVTQSTGGFMGKDWDGWASPASFQRWCTEWATEALRILKPGGHLLAFGGSRTWHRLACAVEDAGFEIRDSIAWLYGSGFAKSWNFATQYKGEWCTCGGENAVPYNHASNSEMRGLWEDVHETPVTRGKGENASVLEEVQRGAAGRGVEDARSQGAGGVVAGNGSDIRGIDSGRGESVMEGRLVHRAGQGLPDDPESQSPEGASERVRGGASAGDGGNDRASGSATGGSASQESAEDGQPTGESDSVPGSHDALDDGALRGRPVCSRCGGLREEYRGYGSALKPSFEPIVVGRKPLAGTIASNVIEHGTGAINIDGCRVAASDALEGRSRHGGGIPGNGSSFELPNSASTSPAGRWPTNVVLDESQADTLDAQTGILTSGLMKARTNREATKGGTIYGADNRNIVAGDTYADSGGASRFFPTFHYEAKAPGTERPDVDGTQHPTVKPLDLMRWLVRLVTPPNGVVLEPFAGSGTTLEAALIEGFNVIGIEREDTYLPLIMQRITKPLQQSLFGDL